MKKGEIRKIISDSLGLSEAYVAIPKSYDLNTEKLTEKSKKAHEELYEKYIRKLNETTARLDSVKKNELELNTNDYRSLKIDETYNLNAVWLHELFFANISDIHSEVFTDSLAFMRLERDFGSFDNWQNDFIACGQSARNGWVMTAYHTFLQRYVNVCIDSHDMHVMVGLYPVIVLDCWEHAYHDFFNDRNSYIRSMMMELDWEIIEERFKKADRIGVSIGGKT